MAGQKSTSTVTALSDATWTTILAQLSASTQNSRVRSQEVEEVLVDNQDTAAHTVSYGTYDGTTRTQVAEFAIDANSTDLHPVPIVLGRDDRLQAKLTSSPTTTDPQVTVGSIHNRATQTVL